MYGQRVPVGMEDHANWKDLPEHEIEEVDVNAYGPEFKRIYTERQSLLSAKKAVVRFIM